MKDYIMCSIRLYFDWDDSKKEHTLKSEAKIEGFCNNVEECYKLKGKLKREPPLREFFIAEIIEEDV